jgi:L-lactate dehydrogenase complex protein LldG
MTSRDQILNKLRAARPPFPDAPPRPQHYQPVTTVADTTPEGLLARFTAELERLAGQVWVVEGDAAARDKILDLLGHEHQASHILAWDFTHIPVTGLREAIEAAGVHVTIPLLHDDYRAETIAAIRDAEVGLTGAEAAIAATGTLVVRTAAGKGRIPTILPPVHIVVVTLDQLLPRLEDWAAHERASGLKSIHESANIAFISGPSRTGDIEMALILGVHGPKVLQVIIKR